MTLTGDTHAFLTSASGLNPATDDLGTLGGQNSRAFGLDSLGNVVGESQDASGDTHGFLYSGGALHDLGFLAGGQSSSASALNSAGRIVGTATDATLNPSAFLYTAGSMYNLNDITNLDPGWRLTGAYGINDGNQIVGVGIFNGDEHAVLLTQTPEPGSLTLIGAGVAGFVLRAKRRQRSRK